MTQRYSSLLELEAADYFKLDLSQVQMFNSPISSHRASVKRLEVNHRAQKQVVDRNLERSAKANLNPKERPMQTQMKTKIKPKMVSNQRSDHQKGGRSELVRQDSNQTRVIRIGSRRLDTSESVKRRNEVSPVMATSPYLADSSTASTNSLPSISSSPSVSPSLVCPHLSLDDILRRTNGSKSPHTIGLCSKCRMDPPANVHSPLSPAFKPSKTSQMNQSSESIEQKVESRPLRRGYSDQQVGARRLAERLHEDSLDYYLEPSELRRLQMSPTIRNSVEFIRNTTTEAGRVLRIYKNGEPFDRPLRICVSRGEFATLNNLLDFIASRQLIPSGARYLFHLDGQLVYSVNELKHGSIYIVSGTRKFDHKTNSILKEQLKRELESPPSQHRRTTAQPDATQVSSNARKPIDESDLQLTHPAEPATPERLKSHPPVEIVKDLAPTHKQKDDIDAPKSRNRERLSDAPKSSKSNKKQPTNFSYAQQESGLSSERIKLKHPDDSTRKPDSMSKSNENLMKEQRAEEKPVSLVRAKSELGALPNKRRKNVTFMDAQWDANHGKAAQSEKDLDKVGRTGDSNPTEIKSVPGGAELASEAVDPSLKALATSEIGIQVSDSIDGFLIDLPIPMPPKGDELREKRSYLRKGQGIRMTKNAPVQVSTVKKNQKSPVRAAKPKQPSSTKTRRQVVTITERQLSLDEMDQFKDLDHGDHHREAHKIQHVTITLDGADDVVASDEEQQDGNRSLAADKNMVMVENPSETISIGQVDEAKHQATDTTGADETGWQYPGGRQSSATPTERPVSQSEANETVHARVTTPTPSLSTNGGDSLSQEPPASSDPTRERPEVPTKRLVPVCGRLCQGADPPSSNFRLEWVNGFTINDHYPENSAMLGTQPLESVGSDSEGLLSPSQPQRSNPSSFQFKPSDRFHNWICHSRRYDELIYPAGVLIVLWCRKTNEQRYYSKHTASVCCVTLGSIDEDIAASGQLGGSDEKISAAVHLWSLASLDTLRVVDDEQLIGKKILSLKVRNTASEGCELSVSARDDKRVWVHIFYLDLSSKHGDEAKDTSNSKGHPITVIKANKVLQAGQIPLLLAKVSNQSERTSVPIDSTRQPLEDLFITFGRRHFQVWYADRRHSKLCLLSVEKKSADFVELVVRANCLTRMSPVEYLVGDASGGITMLLVNTLVKANSKFKLGSKLASEDKYSVEMVPLYMAGPEASPKSANSITCLARISGSMFVSCDATCTLKFWYIDRKAKTDPDSSPDGPSGTRCRLLNSICLPRDLGFVCTIIMSKFNRKQSIVEFYVVSTSNAILFGSVQLRTGARDSTGSDLTSLSLSVLYEGHESFAINLVADCAPPKASKPTLDQAGSNYFTCSLDYKICKWSGKSLVWKSMLPSACASLAVHPVGFVLAVGSADGTVYILDKISGLLISYFPLTPVCINCLTYSRDGLLLAAGCANGSIFILPVYERGLKYKKVSIFQVSWSSSSILLAPNDSLCNQLTRALFRPTAESLSCGEPPIQHRQPIHIDVDHERPLPGADLVGSAKLQVYARQRQSGRR